MWPPGDYEITGHEAKRPLLSKMTEQKSGLRRHADAAATFRGLEGVVAGHQTAWLVVPTSRRTSHRATNIQHFDGHRLLGAECHPILDVGTNPHEMADGAEARASRQRIAFEELLEGIRQESERMERLEGAIREVVPEWSLAEVVPALKKN